ncbi:Hypothetical protein NTJ_02448 [Nesidiocoris tenuis]|uniref:Uncharacterized protein n=1 Tax=Nesidiocoris tenuis TaxID=355587 RepID=A0ABN7AFI1_9HEMI|nr:Hypothetical protein NTJ_02448 [Nesidiocoris tenuis]
MAVRKRGNAEEGNAFSCLLIKYLTSFHEEIPDRRMEEVPRQGSHLWPLPQRRILMVWSVPVYGSGHFNVARAARPEHHDCLEMPWITG